MTQELKDALADLTKQADKLEEFESCSSWERTKRCGRTPSSDDFLRARQYRLLVKTMTQTHTALTALLDRYVGLVNSGDAGDWDPETEQEVLNAREALNQPET